MRQTALHYSILTNNQDLVTILLEVRTYRSAHLDALLLLPGKLLSQSNPQKKPVGKKAICKPLNPDKLVNAKYINDKKNALYQTVRPV